MKADNTEILVSRVLKELGKAPNEIERLCWSVIHEHIHGVKPVEYDIREIDEELYLSVLETVKKIKENGII